MSDDEAKNKFDWKSAGLTFLLVAAQGFVQYGVITAKMDEYSRRIESLEKKMDDRTLSRDEFEKRHAEVERRLSELERRELFK